MSPLDLEEERRVLEEQRVVRDKKNRREYISHESVVRSLSLIYFTYGTLLLVFSFYNFRNAETVATLLAVGAVSIFVGTGLLKLAPWARVVGGIVSVFGLMNLTFWTIIHGYALYILFCEKGGFVFSEPYQRSIRATQEMKWKFKAIPLLVVLIAILYSTVAVFEAITSKNRLERTQERYDIRDWD